MTWPAVAGVCWLVWQDSLQLLQQLSVAIEDFVITVGCTDASIVAGYKISMFPEDFQQASTWGPKSITVIRDSCLSYFDGEASTMFLNLANQVINSAIATHAGRGQSCSHQPHAVILQRHCARQGHEHLKLYEARLRKVAGQSEW